MQFQKKIVSQKNFEIWFVWMVWMLRISKIDSKKCEIDTTKKSIFCVLDFFYHNLVVQKCIPNAWTRVKVLLYFQIHSHTTSDFCYGALGIIWYVTGYFVTKLRLCICDTAPCSNTLFKAVDINQKITFVSHKQYIQISLNAWTANYSSYVLS